jgi:hypothetical protein
VTLVVIYGAPGVGKLTTAKALAALTGFRIFHNHLSFDLAKAVFEFPTLPFQRLAETVRLATFEAAARENLPGLVFTFGYASPEDDAFVEKMIQVVERHGGELAFVRLFCDRATHERRVLSEDRQRFGKITNVQALRGALAQWNFAAAIRVRQTLEIDNSALEVELVARQIAAHYSLPLGSVG